MASGHRTPGRRLYVAESGNIEALDFLPGDYAYDPMHDRWIVRPPRCGCAVVDTQLADVHEDLTITIRPHLEVHGRGNRKLWAGYLRRGTWVEWAS